MATYLPGERLLGVSVSGSAVDISVVATLERPLLETADEVRRAVTDLAGDRPVNVRIDDIALADTEKADTEKADTETADTETADTEKHDTARSGTATSDTEKHDTMVEGS
ncbi:hypothetical protein [Nonomuraea sp. NPDC002799]